MAYLIGTGARDWNNSLNWSSTSGGTGADTTTGIDLLTNGDFSSSTGWVLGDSWTISGGKASHASGTGTSNLTKVVLTAGKAYKITYTIDSISGGAIWSYYGAVTPETHTTPGTYSDYIVSMSAVGGLRCNATTVCVIDNITIEEVTCFPSTTEPAILDANSGTGTITIAGTDAACASFDCSAITSAITLTSATVSLYNYGALILDSQLTWTFTSTAYLYMKATSSVAMTMNGATFNGNRVYFDGIGGTWTNSDACNLGSSTIYLINGTWNTNGQTITTTGSFITAVGTKVLTLGSSEFNVGVWSIVSVGGFTFNYNTSTVVINNTSIIRANAFYNLTLIGAAVITSSISVDGDITVSNTLTITGNNSTNYRLLVASSTIGTQHTITAATLVASNVDFRDIKLAGACSKDLSAITGNSGDCGGNSDITFTTAQTQYYKHTSGACTWKDATKWFTDITPRTTAGRVPLPQDSAILDADSFTGSSTLTIDVPRKGSVDMSAVNQAVSTVLANSVEHYGHLILGNNITPSGNYTRALIGSGNYDLNTYGKTIYNLQQHSGTYTNKSNLSVTAFIDVYRGTFNFNNYNSTSLRLLTDSNATIYLGSGIIEIIRISGTILSINSGSTIYCETSTIKLNPLSGSDSLSFNGGVKTFNKVWFSGTHTGYFDITGANNIAWMVIDKGRKVRPANGVTQQVGKLTAIGTQAEPITITSPTAAVHTLNYTGTEDIQADWLYLHYSTATPANKWFAGNGSAYLPPMGNGLLYNWYAVNGDGTKTLAPVGCHIPTSAEWATLSTYLGGNTVSGGKLKSMNPLFWTGTNVGATNEVGFFGFGSGLRNTDGTYTAITTAGELWASEQATASNGYGIYFIISNDDFYISSLSKNYGFSVRCLCDTPYFLGQVITDIDGNRYGTVKIGDQTWLTSNLKVTHYTDGTAIPNVTDNSAWTALTTGAYCSYNNAAIVEYPSNNDGWVMKNVSKGMLNLF